MMEFDLIQAKRELLDKYQQHYNKLKIGSRTTTNVQKIHFQAIHVYLRILEYFSYVDPDKVDIEWELIEDVYLELQKSLYLTDTTYYA